MEFMKLSRMALAFVMLFVVCTPSWGVTTAARQSSPAQRADIEKRIDDLLARMTLEEKLGQLQILDGEANGNFRPEHRDLIRTGLLGSTLNVRGTARVNELQRIAMTESRLKIPVLFAFDVIHGYRTIFPVPLGEASSWDAAAVERGASVAAKLRRAPRSICPDANSI